MNKTELLREAASGVPAPQPAEVGLIRLSRATWWHAHGPLGLACAAALALAFACWLYSLPMLTGAAPFWWREAADTTQYIAGFNAYVRDAWHWPLLRIDSLNTPHGTLATFLDTVPLYAFFLKLLHHGPDTPFRNPYGAWIALCFLLQGAGAWWICREACTRRWSTLVALTLLLASFPALTFRISHTSLMSQWILLFGLAIYIRSTRLGRLAMAPWLVLVPCAFYINIYLFAMLSALLLADVLRQLGRGSAASALLTPLAAYGLLFASAWVMMLPMPAGAGTAEWGFGYYSMNLLAPLDGGRLLTFDHGIGTEGQGEGYNYLGVFMVAAAVLAWRLRKRHDPGYWQRHWPLAALLALMAVYAVSNIVYLGPVKLFTVHADLAPLTSTFRSSGRFFWPVGYAVFVFAVLGIARHLPARRAALLLGALTVAQLADLGAHHQRARATVAEGATALVDVARWDAFLGKDIHALQYYPAYRCSKAPPQEALLPTMLYAVRRGYALSTGYIARAASACDTVGKQAAALPSGQAIVFEKSSFPDQQPLLAMIGTGAVCADMGTVYLCRRTRPE